MEKKTVAALLAVMAVAGVGATVTDDTKGKIYNESTSSNPKFSYRPNNRNRLGNDLLRRRGL